jgi:hypothetical protein
MRTKTGAFAADCVGEPGRGAGFENQLKNVRFGEEHMHTRNSFDSLTVGVNPTRDDARNDAKEKEVTLSTSGERIKNHTPYGSVAITDHANGVSVRLTT